MMRASPPVVHAEAVASVAALGGSTGRHCARYGVSRFMDRIPITIDIAALLNERGRATCDALRALLRLLLRVARCNEKTVEPNGEQTQA